MNLQHYHNKITTQKPIAMYFKEVKTEEIFSNQDQKLVETNCDNLIETKTIQRKFASAMTITPVELNK